MTKSEKNLLDELKEFFTKKYDKDWEPNFKKYTSKLVKDGHINQEIVDEYLDSDEKQLDEIVKKFASFSKKSSSSRSYSSGCGSSSRSSC